jgi:hypothetical protein
VRIFRAFDSKIASTICGTSRWGMTDVNHDLSGADETDGFSPARHLEVIAEHEPRMRFDVILVDAGPSRHA